MKTQTENNTRLARIFEQGDIRPERGLTHAQVDYVIRRLRSQELKRLPASRSRLIKPRAPKYVLISEHRRDGITVVVPRGR